MKRWARRGPVVVLCRPSRAKCRNAEGIAQRKGGEAKEAVEVVADWKTARDRVEAGVMAEEAGAA